MLWLPWREGMVATTVGIAIRGGAHRRCLIE